MIHSKRLYYRHLTDDDVGTAYIEWMNDPVVTEYLESKFETHTHASILDYVEAMNQNPDVFLFGIFDHQTDQHIGNIKLNYTNRYHQRGDIGIVIGIKAYWGAGIGTEAVSAITRFGFRTLDMQQISAGCFEMNRASVHAFQKVGYRVEGVIQKNILYHGERVNGVLLGILPDELVDDERSRE
jgi:[ribosomal protein S5]-alanine N-acetyltransferase